MDAIDRDPMTAQLEHQAGIAGVAAEIGGVADVAAADYTPEESRYDERLIQILSRFWITSTTSGGNQMLFRSSAIFPADNRGTRYERPYGRFRNNGDVLRYFGASFAFGKTVMSGQLRWRSHSL